jgi:arylsulfatase A-like enzyme
MMENQMSPMTPQRILSVLALVLFTAAAGGCSGRNSRLNPSAGTPVILISIDTLRSDRLPAYGYTGVETPHIDSFRKDAVLFEQAYSHCPLTLPAHASMFTGELPSTHGIRDNVGFTLDPSIRLLPEVLKANGYQTGAAVSGFVLRKNAGLARGFDFYDDDFDTTAPEQVIGRIQRNGAETIAASRDWIRTNQSRPFFYFLHLYDPHTPYEPPEPFRTRYAADPYDGEIAYTDQIVGEFLSSLKTEGIYDRAMIIITSDHGEGLGDHGEDEHGIFLYREAIQIPLLVKFPLSSHAGASVETVVQLIDLFPTIVEQTATRHDVSSLPGRSVASFIGKPREKRFAYSETLYPRLHFGWSDLHSLVDGEKHYIQAPKPELYDLKADAAQKRNILSEERRTYAAMKREIEVFVREASTPAKIDPEEAARLAALGYLGSTVQVRPGELLPDPKDKIEVFAEVRRALTDYKNEEYDEAIRRSTLLLAENPLMVDVWDIKARSLMKRGDLEHAISAAREGLKVSSNASHLAILVANLSLELRRDEDAVQHAELLLERDPMNAHEILARVWLHRGDFARAEEHARIALEQEGDPLLALVTLGRIARDRHDYPTALKYLDDVAAQLREKKRAPISMLHFLRGDVLARVGRSSEAVAAFREEIRAFPAEPSAYRNLILLLVSEGRSEEATRLVFELIETAPRPQSYLAVAQTLETVGDERGARYWLRKGLERYPDNAAIRARSASFGG